jgi:hypothetical protein
LGQVLNLNFFFIVGWGFCMAKFLAVHPMSSHPTFAEAMPIARMVKASSTVDAYWVRGYAQLDEEGRLVRMFCEWNARKIEDVQRVLADVPIEAEGIYPMSVVDSEDFR